MATKKFLDYAGLQLLWTKIVNLVNKKIDSVEGEDNSIRVVNGRKIAVNISQDENNVLQRKADGLYVSKTAAMKPLKFGPYIYDGSEEVVVKVYDGDYDINN